MFQKMKKIFYNILLILVAVFCFGITADHSFLCEDNPNNYCQANKLCLNDNNHHDVDSSNIEHSHHTGHDDKSCLQDFTKHFFRLHINIKRLISQGTTKKISISNFIETFCLTKGINFIFGNEQKFKLRHYEKYSLKITSNLSTNNVILII